MPLYKYWYQNTSRDFELFPWYWGGETGSAFKGKFGFFDSLLLRPPNEIKTANWNTENPVTYQPSAKPQFWLSLPPWLCPPPPHQIYKQCCHQTFFFNCFIFSGSRCYKMLSMRKDTIRVAPAGKLGKYRKWVLWGQEVTVKLFVREQPAVSPLR